MSGWITVLHGKCKIRDGTGPNREALGTLLGSSSCGVHDSQGWEQARLEKVAALVGIHVDWFVGGVS